MSETTIPLLEMYRTMLTIRRFEERCNHLYMQGRIPSTLHLYIGQEAVATGVCAHLRNDDYALSTHRPHGHSIAKGVAPRAIMALSPGATDLRLEKLAYEHLSRPIYPLDGDLAWEPA